MKKNYTINDLPQDERPRERLQRLGAEDLSLQELIAIILSRGTSGESVMNIAQNLISRFGSVNAMQEASLEDLQMIKGLGPAKACQLKAAFALAKKVQNDEIITSKKKGKQIISPEEVYKLVKSKIIKYSKEHFMVASFDTRNKLLGLDIVSIGTLNANLVHPRETFEAAIRRHAAAIIIVHNHPSNDPDPSNADIEITKQLVKAGGVLGIEVLDHIIVTKDNYYSFKRHNLM